MLHARPPFDQLLMEILSEFGDFEVAAHSRMDTCTDYHLGLPDGRSLQIEMKAYQRITPASAESACQMLRRRSDESGVEPVLYAAVVSKRTAEIAKEHRVSWMDFVGNCRLVFPGHGIYVNQSGIRNPFGKTAEKNLNIFSSKSSRVVRVMLQEPSRGWQLGELAKHPDVCVSPGLMSRIKKSMVDEGYAWMSNDHLRLKRPKDLLRDWGDYYRTTSPKQTTFYMRGDLEAIENNVAAWCSNANIEHALSHFSAAWRLAPEVRYSVATFLVSAEAIRDDSLLKFREQCGARTVDSGANLMLQIPDDESHFNGRSAAPILMTSPLQTYLDLMLVPGRGEEAAEAIYEKFFEESFNAAAHEAESLA